MATKTISVNRLNLVIDDNFREILDYFGSKYPLLKDPDLIKMAVSGYYVIESQKLPIYKFSDQEDQSLAKSLKSKTSTEPVFESISELVEFLEK